MTKIDNKRSKIAWEAKKKLFSRSIDFAFTLETPIAAECLSYFVDHFLRDFSAKAFSAPLKNSSGLNLNYMGATSTPLLLPPNTELLFQLEGELYRSNSATLPTMSQITTTFHAFEGNNTILFTPKMTIAPEFPKDFSFFDLGRAAPFIPQRLKIGCEVYRQSLVTQLGFAPESTEWLLFSANEQAISLHIEGRKSAHTSLTIAGTELWNVLSTTYTLCTSESLAEHFSLAQETIS
jgi:hypothetical protein